MVVKSFIQHLKSVGEFDGQEKFDKVLNQFTYTKDGKRKSADHLYEDINRSWKSWIKGEFEVDGIDRAQLKKELKARGIDYSQIDSWKAAQTQKRGTDKIAEIKFLDNQNNKFPKRPLEQVKELFDKKFPNGNFYLRVNNLTELKNTGVYVSGANSERSIVGVNKGNRATWLKKAYGKQFAGNYSKIINAADQLVAAGENTKAKRLYDAADKFFGPNGIVRKSAVGEAEHALARSFDFLNPDRQLAINSIVSGDLNQFKKNLFDIPVKRYFNEYNNPNTTKNRRVELKNLIEERKKIMNAITGGQKKGIVAGNIVNFRYGANEITATSNVKPIDTLFKQGKFNIDDYIQKGNKYTKSFQTAAKELNILNQSGKLTSDASTPIKEGSPLFKKLMNFCPKSSGATAGVCSVDEAMKGMISEAEQLKSGKMNTAQANQTAKKLRAVKAVGTGSTLMATLGPYGIGGEVALEGMFIANDMLDKGKTYKEALSTSLLRYVMPTDKRKELEKSQERNKLILGNDTTGLAASYVDSLNKIKNMGDAYNKYQMMEKDQSFDPFTLESTYSPKDIIKAEKDFYRAMRLTMPKYGVDAFKNIKYDSPAMRAFETKEEVFNANRMKNKMAYDDKILGPIKDLFGTGYYTDEELERLQREADQESLAIGQIPDEDKMQMISEFGGVSKLASGGIASLSGGDKSGPAPESGPQPQGLPYVYNRVKRT